MISRQLISPKSIAVIGASEDTSKPGGKVLLNLIAGGFDGNIYAVNPKLIRVNGAIPMASTDVLPLVDLAFVSIPAQACVDAVATLTAKGVKAFIIFSAGFSEAGEEGKRLEKLLLNLINSAGATLVGTNCIGIINQHYKGVFTSPVPKYDPAGCELVSSSGATAVFIMEAAASTGLRFSNIYSIGNSSQTGAEELLEYMDHNHNSQSPKVKLLYLENIENPFKFLKHASSLIRKGCSIAAIKSGFSEAGSRAASSHTGALATSDSVVRALFKKAGIVYCSSREELITAGCIFQSKQLTGERIAIITHAGGSAVMLTDALASNGLIVPHIEENSTAGLLSRLHPGSSVSNPIDFLATGTAAQLSEIIEFCDDYEGVDAMIVVFGSPGLFNNVHDVYRVIHEKMQSCRKPIYPVLPSLINAKKEIEEFLSYGHVNFPDEVVLGKALPHVFFSRKPTFGMTHLAPMETATIRSIISQSENGYLSPDATKDLLSAAGLNMPKSVICYTPECLQKQAGNFRFPVVLKVVGPLHKTDVGGVSLNLLNQDVVETEFKRLMQIPGAKAVLMQEMIQGEELFVGAVRQGKFGHLVLCGLGGVLLEVLNDVANGLAPLTQDEALDMIRSLKGYRIIKGYRGREGVSENLLADAVVRIASLVHLAPEIAELDINPFKGSMHELIAIDSRIRIEK